MLAITHKEKMRTLLWYVCNEAGSVTDTFASITVTSGGSLGLRGLQMCFVWLAQYFTFELLANN